MVVCPSLSPFTMMKITTYGGRHLSHIQPFLSLSRVLFRARTFLLFNSLSLSNGKTSCRTVSNLPSGNTFPFGESGAQAPREVTIFYKSTMKASSLGGIWNSMVKAFPLGKRKPTEWKCSNSAEHIISFRLNWGKCHRRDLLLLNSLKMAKRGFLSLEISIDYPNLQSK